jgi:hypothetical protein
MHLIALGVNEWLVENGYDAACLSNRGQANYAIIEVRSPSNPVRFHFTNTRVYGDPRPETVAYHTNPAVWAVRQSCLIRHRLPVIKPLCEFSCDLAHPDLLGLVASYLDRALI